jgi:hypothetical protein
VEEWAIMKTLSAKVLDPKHLELAEPLPSTTGEWIRIVIPDADDEIPIVDENEKERIVAAVQLVHDMTSRADRAFGDFRERLAWLSERLPEAITGKPAPLRASRRQALPRKSTSSGRRNQTEGRELAGSLVFEPAGRKPVAGDLNPRRRSAPGAGG